MRDRELNLLLSGVVGSVAHGTSKEDSDVDSTGVFMRDSLELLGLPSLCGRDTSVRYGQSDTVYHEIGFFLDSVVKGNPTMTEVLFLERYLVKEEAGEALLNMRSRLLSRSAVITGYVSSSVRQAEELAAGRFSSRAETHAYHVLRVMQQAEDLLKYGEFCMNIASYADELKSQAEMVITRPSDFLSHVSKKALHITNMDSRLAYTPDLREISTWLFDLRIRSAKETKGV
jgi:predicted nucleotidyltransferase